VHLRVVLLLVGVSRVAELVEQRKRDEENLVLYGVKHE
jgi:hypothetical protein